MDFVPLSLVRIEVLYFVVKKEQARNRRSIDCFKFNYLQGHHRAAQTAPFSLASVMTGIAGFSLCCIARFRAFFMTGRLASLRTAFPCIHPYPTIHTFSINHE